MAKDSNDNTPLLRFTLPLNWSTGTDIAGSIFLIFISLILITLGVWGLLYYTDAEFIILIILPLIGIIAYVYSILHLRTVTIDAVKVKVTYTLLKSKNFDADLENCDGYMMDTTSTQVHGMKTTVKTFLLKFNKYILLVPTLYDPTRVRQIKNLLDQNHVPDVTEKITSQLLISIFLSSITQSRKLLRDLI